MYMTDSMHPAWEGLAHFPDLQYSSSDSKQDHWNLKPEPDLQNSGKRPVQQGLHIICGLVRWTQM